MKTTKLIRLSAAAAVALTASAAATFSAGAGSALAPEPAKLSAALPATSGAVAVATYVNTNTSTSVRFYTGSWTADSYGPAAGTPCSTTGLVDGAVTQKVIQAMVTSSTVWRRCV